jgi:sugar O-acyltransferase (sialic acid O-acetyltransferase NeuD family)
MIILGAGGFAKQLLSSLDFHFSDVYLFDDQNLANEIDLSKFFSVLENWNQVADRFVADNNDFIVGVGNPEQRKALFKKAVELGGNPVVAVSSNASVSQLGSKVFNGTSILRNTVVEPYTVIQEGVAINVGSFVAHDCSIGSFSVLGPYSKLLGNVSIGKRCVVGAGATVLPNITVSDGVVIGAGAVVTKNVEPNTIMVGNPAKPLKRNIDS